MIVDLDALAFESFAVCVSAGLTVVVCYDYTTYIKSDIFKFFLQTKHVLVVCDAEVSSNLVLFDVACTDHHDNLSLVLQLEKHLQLAVRLETRQYAACMIVIK